MNKLKKYLLNIWYGLPFGMKAASDEIIGAGNSLDNDTTISQEVSDKRVAKHLLKGEITVKRLNGITKYRNIETSKHRSKHQNIVITT
jgi:hypothetical protein